MSQNIIYILYIAVYVPPKEKCLSQQLVTIDQGKNILASSISRDTSCGFHGTPWLIQARPGQRINLTLIDFAWTNGSVSGCSQRYGYILDTESDDVINICGGMQRKRALYLSSGYSLQVVLDENSAKKFQFLIQFEGEFAFICFWNCRFISNINNCS